MLADVYPNTAATINSSFEVLRKGTQISSVNYPVVPAAEYLLDDGFDQIVKQPEPLFCISAHLVLVEFSFIAPPVDYKEKLFQMQLRGFQPVLAHPERYLYWFGNKRVLDQLQDAGCLFA
jgi:tyrosine-protein phosphatase YwqE